MARAKLETVSTKGQFDQTINPGDKVVFMTVRAHSHKFGQGTYQGLVNGGARIEEDYFFDTRHHPITGEDLTDYNKFNDYVVDAIGRSPERPRWREQDYEAKQSVYEAYNNRRTDLYRGLTVKKNPAKRLRSLQNNVIFKLA